METILVVDDEKEIVSVLSFILENNGYKVITASNGGFGLRKFHEFNPDLVLIDVFMPRKNGIETIKEILSESPDSKIIAMSGGGRMINMDEKVKELNELGVKYIDKPFEEDEIIGLVKDVLSK